MLETEHKLHYHDELLRNRPARFYLNEPLWTTKDYNAIYFVAPSETENRLNYHVKPSARSLL